ncbi:MAG: hypothetical protein CVU77_00590 [Elusimicrobia bacterium HGW-Elusimicrobia-1]|jgi:hypothetical protein|nr:MAG: hypothetical protein CVU77_00590 [Elusimicrobia bacterium HGW-Elusimicrobia-1]
MKPSDYASSVGVVKALESRLIPAHKLRRLADFTGEDDFMRGLSDTSYASRKFPPPTLDSEAGCLISSLFEKYLVDKPLRDVFTAEHGFAAALAEIKLALASDSESGPAAVSAHRAAVLRRELSAANAGCSAAMPSADAITSAVDRQKFFGLPEPLPEVCGLLTSGKSMPSAAAADFAAYAAFFSWALDKTSAFPAARHYFKIRVDAVNAANYARCVLPQTGDETSPVKTDFFAGGFIDKDVFSEAVGALVDPTSLFSSSRFHEYRKSFSGAGAHTPVTASKFIDDASTDYWVKMRLEPFGFHHVCGYAHALKTEIKNLKIISAGIRSHLPPADIKNRLRHSYF